MGIEQEADLVLGLLNHAAQYCVQGEAPLSVPAKTPFEIGALKNRYGPTGCWAWLSFEGQFGLIDGE